MDTQAFVRDWLINEFGITVPPLTLDEMPFDMRLAVMCKAAHEADWGDDGHYQAWKRVEDHLYSLLNAAQKDGMHLWGTVWKANSEDWVRETSDVLKRRLNRERAKARAKAQQWGPWGPEGVPQ